MTQPPGNRYRVEVDAIDPRAWYELVAGFSDASLYQLWHHGAGPSRFTSVSRLVLRDGADVVAAAEARLFRLPFLQRGIAYVLWGPLCRRATGDDVEMFRQAIRAMRHEYVARRGMVLRISPRLFADLHAEQLRVLSEEGFNGVEHVRATRSLLVDLSPDVADIRRDLDKRWRNSLAKAERAGLVIASGTGLGLFDQFVEVYQRLLARKQFAPSADIEKHRRIQQDLPEHLKMRVVLATLEGRACAGAIYTALGDTAVYLFGATDETGLRTSAAYLVQWHILNTLKAGGVRAYDLNGIDPVANPGTCHFKRGLGGKKGQEVTFAGQFQAASPSLGNYSLLLVDRVRQQMRLARTRRAAVAAAQ